MDGSGEICDSYAALDQRVRVIHKQNGGVSSARNAGLEIAQGEYIVFFDGDDLVDTKYLESLYTSRSDLTICGVEVKSDTGATQSIVRYSPKRFASREEIPFGEMYGRRMFYSPWCKLFRSDLISGGNVRFPEGISWGEDSIFVADYLQHIKTVAVLDYVGYYYVKYSGERTLSSHIKEDMVDTMVTAREYCIDKMCDISLKEYEGVKHACQVDIRFNCAYFIGMLVNSEVMGKREKQRVLARFLDNQYVQQTKKNPEIYYAWDDILQSCMRLETSKEIISAYLRKKYVRHCVNKLARIPRWIKRILGFRKNS